MSVSFHTRESLSSLSKEELINLILQSQLSNPVQHENLKRKHDDIENQQKAQNSNNVQIKPHDKGTSPPRKKRKKSPHKPFDWSKYSKRHVAFKIAYLGWAYHGFTVQQDKEETVEGYLFKALQKTRLIQDIKDANYQRCGRTDRGVSAFGQVVSLFVRSRVKNGLGVIPPTNPSQTSTNNNNNNNNNNKDSEEKEIDYVQALNSVLPDDIRIISWCPVPLHFSARFSALYRTYKYFFYKEDLDIELMRVAGQQFVGRHDFRNFCKIDLTRAANFERVIFSFSIDPVDDGRELTDTFKLYAFTISGQAFLWHQVRCMVAVLFLIGRRLEEPSIISELLDPQKWPQKPVYEMASEIPLVLYDCGFEEIQFVHETDAHTRLWDHFVNLWKQNAMRNAVVMSIVKGLECAYLKNDSAEIDHDQDEFVTWKCLLQNEKKFTKKHKSKNYVQLKDRPKESSFEEKINSLSLKQKTKLEQTGRQNPRLEEQIKLLNK